MTKTLVFLKACVKVFRFKDLMPIIQFNRLRRAQDLAFGINYDYWSVRGVCMKAFHSLLKIKVLHSHLVPRTSFTIHKTVSFHKRFFRLLKCSSR